MRDIGIVSGLTWYVHENTAFPYVFEFWVTNMSREVPIRIFSRLRERINVLRAKVNSSGFRPRLHSKHYNFQWYPFPNNSSSEYHTSPKLWRVVYLLLLYDIQFLDSIYWMVMYQSNRSFHISPGMPRAFDSFSCTGGGGGNLITTHWGWRILPLASMPSYESRWFHVSW